MDSTEQIDSVLLKRGDEKINDLNTRVMVGKHKNIEDLSPYDLVAFFHNGEVYFCERPF